ncbi:PREDICTED: LOW QUALITY PROTEIN: cysteine-rich repeat secretory protein 59 [Camelina sativa]|uniref:LOW QUALITY PROTEIN: cysteine-rich repeat secretory protein 59 n=1 Tax=Camelina sativa TaxID=90675 RepID=A0ABM0UWC3_CAMSA|nr:PREDICTED: LOW QUALITY PROTEIN: cysteine-rich repeat secretory protein 59 [Camelina sativa]
MEITTKKLSVLFCLFFTINQTLSESDHMDTFCIKTSRNTTHNTTYNTNLNTMLSTFRNQSSIVNYYNLTTGSLASDTVYGMFLCTGDVNITTCHNCVKNATIEIAKNCTNHREAIIYYIDCMVRYSDKFFLTTTLETQPNSIWSSDDIIPKSLGPFKKRLYKKMGEVIVRSSMLSSALTPYYYMDETRFDGSYDLGSLVQCSPHLNPEKCTICLEYALQEITDCCSDKFSAIIFTPNCFLNYYVTTPPLPPLPSTSFSIRGNNEILWGMTLAASVFALKGL